MQPPQASNEMYNCSTAESFSSAASISPTAASTSSSLVSKPRLNRMEDSASSPERPMALSTWDGSGVPEVHAEPVDAARCGCKAPKMSCAENPVKRIFALPGWRAGREEPLSAVDHGNRRSFSTNASRRKANSERFSAIFPVPSISAAAPMPTHRGTGVVPDRKPCC